VGTALIPLAIAAALLVAAIVLQGRKALFWFAFLLPFVPVEYVDRYHTKLPTVLKWSPLLGTLAAAVLACVLLPRVRTRIPRGVVHAMLAIVGFSLVSMALNGTNFAAFAVAQRGWIVAVATMVALKTGYHIYSRAQLHGFLVAAGLVSSAVSVLQRLIIVPMTSGPDPADRVTGLFSIGYLQLFFHMTCIGITLSYWLNGKRVLPFPSLAVAMVLVLSLVVGNEKASLLYMLALVPFLIWRSGFRQSLRRSWKPLAIMGSMPLLMLVGYGVVNDPGEEAVEEELYVNQIFDPEYVHRYLFGDKNTRLTSGGSLRRGAAVLFAYEEIADDPVKLMLGAGPGETAESRLPGASGRMASRNPNLSINRLSLSMTLGDLGLLGLLLNAVFLAAVWFAGRPGEPPEHARVREVFVLLAAGYCVYANMTNEAVYCLLMAVVLYPNLPPRGEEVPAP
jgi:hypothetical protein